MKLGRLRLGLRIPSAWFLGYQKYGDSIGTEWLEFFIIPGLAFRVGWHWRSEWLGADPEKLRDDLSGITEFHR